MNSSSLCLFEISFCFSQKRKLIEQDRNSDLEKKVYQLGIFPFRTYQEILLATYLVLQYISFKLHQKTQLGYCNFCLIKSVLFTASDVVLNFSFNH